MAAARGSTASSTVWENVRRPSMESSSPHACKSAGCGSMPTHKGPRASIAAASRAPKGARPPSWFTGLIWLGILRGQTCGKNLGVFLQARDIPLVGAQRLHGLDGHVELGDRGDAGLAGGDGRRADLVAVAASLATGGGVEDHGDLAVVDQVNDGALTGFGDALAD